MLPPTTFTTRGFVRQHRIQGRCSAERARPARPRHRTGAARRRHANRRYRRFVYGGWESTARRGVDGVAGRPAARGAGASTWSTSARPARHRPRIPALRGVRQHAGRGHRAAGDVRRERRRRQRYRPVGAAELLARHAPFSRWTNPARWSNIPGITWTRRARTSSTLPENVIGWLKPIRSRTACCATRPGGSAMR